MDRKHCSTEHRLLNRIAHLVSIVCIAGTTGIVHSELTFEDTFESGGMEQWQTEGGGTIEVSSEQSRSGNNSLHFRHTNYRCEVTARNGMGNFHWGTEYWLGLSFYLVDWDTASSQWNTVVQTHTVPGDENWGECVSGDNGWTVHANRTELTLHAQEVADVEAVPTTGAIGPTAWETTTESNRWYDWVFHFNFSPDSSGFIEVWVDGEQIADISGPNVHRSDCCGVQREPRCYLKLGSYHSEDYTRVRELYVDEIRIGEENSSWSEVSPGGISGTLGPGFMARDARTDDLRSSRQSPGPGKVFSLNGSLIGHAEAQESRSFSESMLPRAGLLPSGLYVRLGYRVVVPLK